MAFATNYKVNSDYAKFVDEKRKVNHVLDKENFELTDESISLIRALWRLVNNWREYRFFVLGGGFLLVGIRLRILGLILANLHL